MTEPNRIEQIAEKAPVQKLRKTAFVTKEKQDGTEDDKLKRLRKISKAKSFAQRYSIQGHFMKATSANTRTLQSTYRLTSQKPLDLEQLNKILYKTVNNAIVNNGFYKYQTGKEASRLCQYIATELEFVTRCRRYDRFRLIAIVTILERCNQSYWSKMGFVWDVEQDQWANYAYESQTYIINASIIGVYWE